MSDTGRGLGEVGVERPRSTAGHGGEADATPVPLLTQHNSSLLEAACECSSRRARSLRHPPRPVKSFRKASLRLSKTVKSFKSFLKAACEGCTLVQYCAARGSACGEGRGQLFEEWATD